MQRNEPERRRDARKDAKRDASEPMGGQPQPGEDEAIEKPESAPIFLTARELQAREPVKGEGREKPQPGQKRGGD
ncbi:MAG TPA: hypothetical protein VFO24_06095 [Usitatibacter sp.]|nr:hypothetical protein [Usitatibacter sp.]